MRMGHIGEKALQTLIMQHLVKGAKTCKLSFFILRYVHDRISPRPSVQTVDICIIQERHISKWMLQYILETVNLSLTFENSDDVDYLVVGYVNSDYMGDFDKCRTTIGYVFTMTGGPISW